MVIDNFDVRRVSVRPDKADAVLIVDPDAMLAGAIIFQGFERHSDTGQIGQLPCRIEGNQPAKCDTLDVGEPAALFPLEDFLSLGAAKRNNHKIMPSRNS
jgi:hypothetical protein